MSPALSSTQALTRAWKGLGAPRSNGDALAMGPEGFELARAVRETLAPGQLVLLHPDPPPARARFTTATDLDQLVRERPASFDLAAASGGLETGDLAEVRDRLVIGTLLLGRADDLLGQHGSADATPTVWVDLVPEEVMTNWTLVLTSTRTAGRLVTPAAKSESATT